MASGTPSEGYSVENWELDAEKVYAQTNWPATDDIDWDFIWENRAALSDKFGTRGYWTK